MTSTCGMLTIPGQPIISTRSGRCLSLTKRSLICFSGSPRSAPRPPQPEYYPGIEEEYDVSHTAFHRAYQEAKSENEVPGLQEFAAAIWERRRMIASKQDPLITIFDEFDRDNDGSLASPEIAEALVSRGVSITAEQVQWLIDTFEKGRTCVLPTYTHTITRQEWPNFVYSLTISNLHISPDASRSSIDSD